MAGDQLDLLDGVKDGSPFAAILKASANTLVLDVERITKQLAYRRTTVEQTMARY